MPLPKLFFTSRAFWVKSSSFGSANDEREITMTENKARNYGDMTMNELVESIIRDAKAAGTITYPLRTEGYHTCSNLIHTDRLK